MNKILRNLIIVMVGFSFLGACQTGGSLSDAKKPKPFAIPQNKELAKAEEVKDVKKVKESLKINDVLFDYKRWEIKPEYKEVLKNTLGKIQTKESAKLLLYGHTDPRGSKQYNLLLGHKRAYSVKLFLVSLGFAKENIKIKSYGKEKAAAENNDKSWKQDRRVEIQLQ